MGRANDDDGRASEHPYGDDAFVRSRRKARPKRRRRRESEQSAGRQAADEQAGQPSEEPPRDSDRGTDHPSATPKQPSMDGQIRVRTSDLDSGVLLPESSEGTVETPEEPPALVEPEQGRHLPSPDQAVRPRSPEPPPVAPATEKPWPEVEEPVVDEHEEGYEEEEREEREHQDDETPEGGEQPVAEPSPAPPEEIEPNDIPFAYLPPHPSILRAAVVIGTAAGFVMLALPNPALETAAGNIAQRLPFVVGIVAALVLIGNGWALLRRLRGSGRASLDNTMAVLLIAVAAAAFLAALGSFHAGAATLLVLGCLLASPAHLPRWASLDRGWMLGRRRYYLFAGLLPFVAACAVFGVTRALGAGAEHLESRMGEIESLLSSEAGPGCAILSEPERARKLSRGPFLLFGDPSNNLGGELAPCVVDAIAPWNPIAKRAHTDPTDNELGKISTSYKNREIYAEWAELEQRLSGTLRPIVASLSRADQDRYGTVLRDRARASRVFDNPFLAPEADLFAASAPAGLLNLEHALPSSAARGDLARAALSWLGALGNSATYTQSVEQIMAATEEPWSRFAGLFERRVHSDKRGNRATTWDATLIRRDGAELERVLQVRIHSGREIGRGDRMIASCRGNEVWILDWDGALGSSREEVVATIGEQWNTLTPTHVGGNRCRRLRGGPVQVVLPIGGSDKVGFLVAHERTIAGTPHRPAYRETRFAFTPEDPCRR